MERVLTFLLAGGAGTRLHPLTLKRAKPAVPFGGTFRIVDITLSNCINSNMRRIYVLTQHRAFLLARHIRHAWNFLPPELGEFIETMPPPMETAAAWYLGTADAVYQNRTSIEEENLPFCLILAGDHVYRMNYAELLTRHVESGAGATVCTTRVDAIEASRYGILRTDDSSRVIGFEEKPSAVPPEMEATPGICRASMGVYLFSTPLLLEVLKEDAANRASHHDFGHDILPRLIDRAEVGSFEFADPVDDRLRYWRDIGTLGAYYDAHMDLLTTPPPFDLHDRAWPIRTSHQHYLPARFVDGRSRCTNRLEDSLISPGCVLTGCRVTHSVIGPGVIVDRGAEVIDSIVFPGAQIGSRARVRRAIVEAGVSVGAGVIVDDDESTSTTTARVVVESAISVVTADMVARHTT